MTPIQSLAEEVRTAVEADMQQSFINSLTTDRGYEETPIDNTMAIVQRLSKELEDARVAISEAIAEIKQQPHGQYCAENRDILSGGPEPCDCWRGRVISTLTRIAAFETEVKL